MATGGSGTNPDYWSARDLIAALRARRVSAIELLEHAVARIEAHDAKLNAVVVRDFDRARKEAIAADAALARGDRRPLLGLPITVKESFDVAGLPTTWGIPGTSGLRIDEDAVAVSRLKAAGAVVIGKTNVPVMLADWQSYNPVYGVTNNPWDLTRTPGGSSGGSAAALAAGYVALEIGSDAAGSLRAPAHYCGVYAHKPTHGLVPLRGCAPPGVPRLSVDMQVDLVVAGPMARSASDLGLALDVIAGPDELAAVGYTLALPPARHADLKSFRALLLDQHPLVLTGEAVRTALERFAYGLAQAGARVARTSPLLPDLAMSGRLFMQLLMALNGAGLPDDVVRDMRRAAAQFAPDDQSLAALSARGSLMTYAEWFKADGIRLGVADQWRRLFREWDVVVCPIMPTPAFNHDHREMEKRRILVDGRPIRYGDQAMWPSIATLTGLPATAMPIALSAEGLPIGIQIIGPYLEDRTTIALAELAEHEFGGFVAPPGFAN